jgi:hypothetical protein
LAKLRCVPGAGARIEENQRVEEMERFSLLEGVGEESLKAQIRGPVLDAGSRNLLDLHALRGFWREPEMSRGGRASVSESAK